jgi:hypothetical protein
MPYKDISRQRAAQYEYYLRNQGKVRTTSQRAQEAKRAYLQALKDKPCTDCGKRYPYYCMDLDHTDHTNKLFMPSDLPKYSWAKLKAEVLKCEVVCAICHRIRSHKTSAHLNRR